MSVEPSASAINERLHAKPRCLVRELHFCVFICYCYSCTVVVHSVHASHFYRRIFCMRASMIVRII